MRRGAIPSRMRKTTGSRFCAKIGAPLVPRGTTTQPGGLEPIRVGAELGPFRDAPIPARRTGWTRHRPALAPHLAKPDGDVDAGSGAGGLPIGGGGRHRARDAAKQIEDFVRQKPRSRCEEMTATVPVLLRSIKPSAGRDKGVPA